MKLIPILKDIIESKSIQLNEPALSVCSSVLSLYEQTKQSSPWLAYLVEKNSALVGSCAFKSSPQEGRVEIAYFTFPEYEGRGFATEMVSHLLLIARETDPQVEVFAQTLPFKSTSTRILEKQGFSFSKSVTHPEDGLVWEWVKIW